jgi:hypothetical protein
MTPLDPWTGQAAQLTPEQKQAENPAFQAAHPSEAARQQYANPFYGPQSGVYRFGAGARDYLSRAGSGLGDILNKGPMQGGALGAGLAGLAGGALSVAQGSRHPVRNTLLAALLGAGVGAYSGAVRQPGYYKAAGWRMGGDPRADILQALADTPMGFGEKAKMMAAVPQLSDMQAQQLQMLISRVAGAGVGAVISRFLLGAGLMGMTFGGLVGGWMGGQMASQARPDASGYPTLGNRNFAGQSYQYL